jgi:glyoxylase-like metal-dependent hydrolase (beta-lactamase superfamily II)
MELMRLIHSSVQIFSGILLSFSAYAWNLPVGDFEFVAVADNVHVMHGPLTPPNRQNRGFMNNPAVIEGETGLILIDPGSSLPVGDKILEEVAKISAKPVLAVFNSHIHGDHWLGNQAVKRAYPEIDIYAHAKTIAQSQASEGASWLQLMLQLTGGFSRGTEIVPANQPVKHNDRIIIDGEEFIIHSLLPSHTDTDIMIEHVGSRTIFMGDNCFNLRMGRYDDSSSIIGTIAALEYVAARNFDNVVPGHGPSGDNEDVIMPYLNYLRKLEKVVEEGLEAELEDYEIKARVLPQFAYMKHWNEFDVQFGPNLNKMYLELEAF